MTAGGTGAGLANTPNTEALAAGWLEEGQCVDARHLVKTIDVYLSAVAHDLL